MTQRKPIFDAIRTARNFKGFAPDEVTAIDALLDTLGIPGDVGVDAGFMDAVVAHLRFEEGVRSKAYKDHLGYWTIGVGRLIDERRGGRITPEEDAILLANDPTRKGKAWREYVLTDPEINMLLKHDVERFIASMADWPAWQKVQGNTARMVAMLSMCFQLGTAGLKGFINSLKLVERGEWAAAADNMLKSAWAGQTPARAKRVTNMIRTGEIA